jgi:hypothetical protein
MPRGGASDIVSYNRPTTQDQAHNGHAIDTILMAVAGPAIDSDYIKDAVMPARTITRFLDDTCTQRNIKPSSTSA